MRIKALLLGVFAVLVAAFMFQSAGAEIWQLNVTACTHATCNVPNYLVNSSAGIGATVVKNAEDVVDMSSANPGAGTINSVKFGLLHGGASGIGGDVGLTYRDQTGVTTYCTNATAFTNTVGATWDSQGTGGCAWTWGRLGDLEVVITNFDDKGSTDAYWYYATVLVDYTPAAGDSCSAFEAGTSYTLDGTDNCVVDAATDVGGQSVNCTGAGTIGVTAAITNIEYLQMWDGCVVQFYDGGYPSLDNQ